MVFISLAECRGGKRPCQPCVLPAGHFACVLVSLPDQRPWSLVWERDFVCACVQNLKWRPKQRTAASECCEWLLLTRVNLKLWRHWVVVELRAVISISFVLKWRWVLLNRLRDIIVEHSGLNNLERKKEYEKWHFHDRTLFAFSCLPRGFWPLVWV